MLLVFLVTSLLKLVAPQDVEWDHVCVTDPLGRARLHLENNSPRPIVFGIHCYHYYYYYYADVYVPPHTIYTHRVYFAWEDEGYDLNECVMHNYFSNHVIELYVYDYYNELITDEDDYQLYNYTWCTHSPGIEERTQVYTDCKCDHDGLVTYHLVNNMNDWVYLEFSCTDIYWYNDYYYDTDSVYYTVEIPPRSRTELLMIHKEWNNLKYDTCVLELRNGHYEFYYEAYIAAMDYYFYYYYGYQYYLESMTYCMRRPFRGEPIAEVIPSCPSSPTGSPEIELRADIPAYAVVHCKNGQAHLSAVTQVSAYIDASFHQGEVTSACQFYKQDDVHIYSVTVEVGWGLRDRELFLDSKIYTISCVYNDYGASRSSVERIGSAYIAPEAINVYVGPEISTRVFELKILDVLDRQVHVRNMAHGSLVRLMATEDTDGAISGFRAHSCCASNGITSYDILINGCGDGQILDKKEGFYTDGDVVFSPYFQIFKLRGGANIWFDCIFVDCDGSCDGTSCDFVDSPPAHVVDFDRFGEFGH